MRLISIVSAIAVFGMAAQAAPSIEDSRVNSADLFERQDSGCFPQ